MVTVLFSGICRHPCTVFGLPPRRANVPRVRTRHRGTFEQHFQCTRQYSFHFSVLISLQDTPTFCRSRHRSQVYPKWQVGRRLCKQFISTGRCTTNRTCSVAVDTHGNSLIPVCLYIRRLETHLRRTFSTQPRNIVTTLTDF